MANIRTIHVVPASGGEWAVQAHGSVPSSTHSTQGLAVAKVWEMVEFETEVEVVVHGNDGTIHSNLLIRRHESMTSQEEFFDEVEDEALRQEALRIMPSRAELQSLIKRLPPSSIDYSMEDDELPC